MSLIHCVRYVDTGNAVCGYANRGQTVTTDVDSVTCESCIADIVAERMVTGLRFHPNAFAMSIAELLTLVPKPPFIGKVTS